MRSILVVFGTILPVTHVYIVNINLCKSLTHPLLALLSISGGMTGGIVLISSRVSSTCCCRSCLTSRWRTLKRNTTYYHNALKHQYSQASMCIQITWKGMVVCTLLVSALYTSIWPYNCLLGTVFQTWLYYGSSYAKAAPVSCSCITLSVL